MQPDVLVRIKDTLYNQIWEYFLVQGLGHLLWFNSSLIPIYLSVMYWNVALILVCLNDCSIEEWRAVEGVSSWCIYRNTQPSSAQMLPTHQASLILPPASPMSLREAGLGHGQVYCIGYIAAIGTAADWECRWLLAKSRVRYSLIVFVVVVVAVLSVSHSS